MIQRLTKPNGAYRISARVTSFVIFSCPRITVNITFWPSECAYRSLS